MERTCYCCGINETTKENYYCHSCLKVLYWIFNSNAVGIVGSPDFVEHCISCGQWENRRIVWTGRTGYFNHNGDGVTICEWCVQEEFI